MLGITGNGEKQQISGNEMDYPTCVCVCVCGGCVSVYISMCVCDRDPSMVMSSSWRIAATSMRYHPSSPFPPPDIPSSLGRPLTTLHGFFAGPNNGTMIVSRYFLLFFSFL